MKKLPVIPNVLRKCRCMTVLCTVLIAGLLLFAAGRYLLRREILVIKVQNGCLTISRKANKWNFYYDVFNSDDFRVRHDLTFGGRLIEKPDQIDLTLRVPFTIVGKSQLIIAEPNEGGCGLPVEAFRRLILLPPTGSKATELFVIDDLRGRVEIKSPREALAFCRLLTSPTTCYYLNGPGVEVASKDQVNANFVFGSKEELSFYHRAKTNGTMGIVDSNSDLSSLGILSARARQRSNSFEVRRTLLVEEAPFSFKNWFVDVIETVGKDGSYNRRTTNERRAPSLGKYDFGILHPI